MVFAHHLFNYALGCQTRRVTVFSGPEANPNKASEPLTKNPTYLIKNEQILQPYKVYISYLLCIFTQLKPPSASLSRESEGREFLTRHIVFLSCERLWLFCSSSQFIASSSKCNLSNMQEEQLQPTNMALKL